MDADRVVLLSGGADSATGALLSAIDLEKTAGKHALMSHWAAPSLPPLQRDIGRAIEQYAPQTLSDHVQVHHSRGRRTASGARYKKEDSTRSRSILFIAFGLALASVNGVPMWIPENGYASINPPLGINRRGSLSTKTTHPAFINGVRAILAKVGGHNDLVNPFAAMTKGEMFLKVKDEIGLSAASDLLSSTASCSHTGARSYGISPSVSCGVCFGCVLRKASFLAAGIADKTRYLDATGNKRIQDWLDSKSVMPAMRDFLASPYGEKELATLRIPQSLSLAEVADLCNRGRDELRGLAL
jgi:7-cyano-7-deazaguanine synthase in queuosine biosynthesis